MNNETPKAVVPSEHCAEPAQTNTPSATNPDEGKPAEEERKDAPESSKMKRHASEEIHTAEDPGVITIADVIQGDVASYYGPPLNMAGLNDVGMEVDSAVRLYPFPKHPHSFI